MDAPSEKKSRSWMPTRGMRGDYLADVAPSMAPRQDTSQGCEYAGSKWWIGDGPAGDSQAIAATAVICGYLENRFPMKGRTLPAIWRGPRSRSATDGLGSRPTQSCNNVSGSRQCHPEATLSPTS